MSDEMRSDEEEQSSDVSSQFTSSPWKRRGIAVAIAGVVAVLGFTAGRWTGGGASADTADKAGSAETEAGGTGEVQRYTCPMHPDVRSDDPNDTCPVCGMDLVPMKQGSKGSDDSGIPALQLSDRAIEVAKVRTAKAERRKLTRKIRAYGRVEAPEETETDLTSWVRGRIEHLDITARGQRIRRGQRIARLYSPKLESVQKELLQAVSTVEEAKGEGATATRVRGAKSAAKAARARLRVLGMKPAQIDAVVEAGKAREVVDVHASTSGTVRKRHAFEGEWVDVGDSIASLQGIDTVWVQLEVYQRHLSLVDEGTLATITLPNRPGFEREGRIEFIDPVVDPRNGTARARVVMSNADGKLPPGTDVRAQIEAGIDGEGERPPLSVPESAILWTGPRSVVYTYDRTMDPPGFVPREVELGPEAGERRVIAKGLSEGDEVAVNGAFQLDAELQIRGEPSMMTGLPPSQQVLAPVEVPEEGKKFEPAIQPRRVPDGTWYCPMEKTHWAQPEKGNGECPVCGMNLKQRESTEGDSAEGGSNEGHSHH